MDLNVAEHGIGDLADDHILERTGHGNKDKHKDNAYGHKRACEEGPPSCTL